MSPSSSFQSAAALIAFILTFLIPFRILFSPVSPIAAVNDAAAAIARLCELIRIWGPYGPQSRQDTFRLLLATFVRRLDFIQSTTSNYSLTSWRNVEDIRQLQQEVEVVICEFREDNVGEYRHLDERATIGRQVSNLVHGTFKLGYDIVCRGLRIRKGSPPSFALVEANARAYFERARMTNVAFPVGIVLPTN